MNSRTYWQGLMLDEMVFKIQTGKIYERQEDLHQETAKLANVTGYEVQVLRQDQASAYNNDKKRAPSEFVNNIVILRYGVLYDGLFNCNKYYIF